MGSYLKKIINGITIHGIFLQIGLRILVIISAICIFCGIIILWPKHETNIVQSNKIELSYIFVDEYGNEYDIFEQTHGAATDWSFLFEEENNEEGTTKNEEGDEKGNEEGIIKNVENISSGASDKESNNINSGTLYPSLCSGGHCEEGQTNEGKTISEGQTNEGQTTSEGQEFNTQLDNKDYIGNNEGGSSDEGCNDEGCSDEGEHEIKTYAKCTTPWGVVINHGEYVLAYQQREDVPDICNVQKRRCNDGVLDGSFTQGYCHEDVEYTYKKEKVVSYNNKKAEEITQNPEHGKNDYAEFDLHGKINGQGDDPTTIWDNNDTNPNKKDTVSKAQNQKNYENCQAPWGDIVSHGQFVKAYAAPLGFTDDVCKSELRLCLNGELQGKYAYQYCKYTDKYYSEFIEGDKTIFDLYNEAYNLGDGSVADVEQLYDDAEELYGEDLGDTTVDDVVSNFENSHGAEDSYNKKSFLQQVWDRLVSLF